VYRHVAEVEKEWLMERGLCHQLLRGLESLVGLTRPNEHDAGSAVLRATCAIRYGRPDPTRLCAYARALLADAWQAAVPAPVATPAASVRRGPGPRCGVVTIDDGTHVRWASSLSHSAAGPAAAAAVLIQPIDVVGEDRPWTIGVDVEPVHRRVRPGVRRMITPIAEAEAPAVATGRIPILATICAKEALFKSDVAQTGRVLADYAWIEAEPFGRHGWRGTARAAGESTARFTLAVTRHDDAWVAVALSPPR
jgi:hypothetical protein